MFPLILMLGLPYLLRAGLRLSRRAVGQHSESWDAVGAGPADAAPLAMTAALGPAALLATPQGKAALTKGLVLARGARSGNPKAKRRVMVTHAKAKAGDPKAQKEMAVIKSAAALDRAAESDDDFEEGDED